VSFCVTCKRQIIGEGGDVKVCVVDPVEGCLVLCAECFRLDPRRAAWTAHDPRLLGPGSRRMLTG
jgi:hypothetical protein